MIASIHAFSMVSSLHASHVIGFSENNNARWLITSQNFHSDKIEYIWSTGLRSD